MVKKAKPMQTTIEIHTTDAAPFVPADNDLIDDVLRRVIEMAPAFSAALAKEISQQVRQDWAGDLLYIAKNNTSMRGQRDLKIRRDWQMGERLALLERRYGLSERRLRQIIFGQ
jgi:Mor family transcriptional regulator